ncbi:dihydrofolate reductase [Dysgonomonas alginatilytica]|uniref:Dihydrofolate reductase n=1 Tax=Dysgonomonas alginatilytica TaxID=1605892 RepID=A0A2V3PIZ9_9BACT|nr:dihydrofolate reductase [Dysgonomonas alginatilytica]PXV59266.1 dihydrofolate reductase [Dysgonomonas alginatilytica]
MAIISIIVAIDEKNAIGKDNQLLCHLPNDLKYFKSVTQGHTVIMGRNTYESLPNGALPNRRNIVLSRNKDLQLDKCEVCSSLEDAIALCNSETEVFIIGGATVYNKAIDLSDKLYITYIHHQFEGTDAFFPKIDEDKWMENSRIDNEADEKNKYAHTFVVYNKK